MRQAHRVHPRHRSLPVRLLAAAVSLAGVAALFTLSAQVSLPPAGAAVEWVVVGPADVAAKVGEPVQLTGFEVTSGNPVSVTLAVTPSTAGTLTLACAAACAGVTYDLGDGTTDARIRLTGNRSAVNGAIASVRFDPSAPGDARVTATAVDGTLGWLPADEHLYRFVPGTTTRSGASAAAAGSTLHGWQGYLPTVTTDAERTLIRTLADNADVYLGASDGPAEGTWKWNQGPESGTALWTAACGPGARGTCTATGAFNQWRDAEPDDAGGGEDDLVQRSDGAWSDVDGSSGCCATVIEFGGLGTFTPPEAEVLVTVLGTEPVTTTTASSTTTSTTTTTTSATTTTTSTTSTVATPTSTTAATAATTSSTTSTVVRSTTTTRPTTTTGTPAAPALPAATQPVTTQPVTTQPATTQPATTEPVTESVLGAVTARAPTATPPASAPSTTATPPASAPTTTGPTPPTDAPPGTVAPEPPTASTAAPTTAASTTTTPTVAAIGTTSTTEPAPSRVNGEVRLRLQAAIGDTADGREVDFDATGLPPGLELRGIVRSTPTVIAEGTVAGDGTFRATGTLPGGLEPGLHHLELSSIDGTVLARAAFTISAEGTIIDSDAALGVIGGPYDPLQHVPAALAALVSTVVAIGALPRGASSGGGTGGGNGNGGGDGDEGGSVADLDIETDDGTITGTGWGDRHRTWGAPGTSVIDRWSVDAPARIQPRSAITARAIAEGAYLRAMIGSLWASIPIAGTACGAIAWWTGSATQVSPAAAWMAAALALGCVDGLAGLGAAVAISLLAIGSGSITDVPTALTLAGIVVILAGAPVIATATRPLGRLRGRSLADRWDRVADAVLASCVTAFAVQGMTGALSGLRGRTIEIAQHADRLAIVALSAVTGRVVLESLANNHWPARRRSLEPPEQPEPTALQGVLVPIMRGVLLVLASQRFIGTNWALWAGALLYAGPMVLNAAPERLGSHPRVHGIVPRRLSKWFFLLVGGTMAGAVLEHHVDDARTLLLVGFVAAQAPNAIVEVLEALGHDADDTELTWWHRGAGLIAFAVGALFALGHLP